MVIVKRWYQKLRHPQTFPQLLQLTDGSMIQVRAISPKRPFLQLPVDSLTHPSWISQSVRGRGGAVIDEKGKLAKFKARFGGMDEALALGADSIQGLGRSLVMKEDVVEVKTEEKSKGGKKGGGKKK